MQRLSLLVTGRSPHALQSCSLGAPREDQAPAGRPPSTPPSWVRSPEPSPLLSLPFPSRQLRSLRSAFLFFCVKESCSVNSVIFSTAGFQVFVVFDFHVDQHPPSLCVSPPAETGTGGQCWLGFCLWGKGKGQLWGEGPLRAPKNFLEV